MTQLKRRLAILLSFIMVFTTVFVAAPMEAQAKTTTTYYFSGPATYGDNNTIKTYMKLLLSRVAFSELSHR